MATAAAPALQEKMSRNPGKLGMIVFGAALVVGIIYAIVSINMLMAWVLTLPVAMMLSGFLYWAFRGFPS
jgi:phosphate/sulfate permease